MQMLLQAITDAKRIERCHGPWRSDGVDVGEGDGGGEYEDGDDNDDDDDDDEDDDDDDGMNCWPWIWLGGLLRASFRLPIIPSYLLAAK